MVGTGTQKTIRKEAGILDTVREEAKTMVTKYLLCMCVCPNIVNSTPYSMSGSAAVSTLLYIKYTVMRCNIHAALY